MFRVLNIIGLAIIGVSGITAAASVDDDALMSKRPQRLLSAYGLFADGAAQKPNGGLIAYDLQIPLFTDYAEKYRFVYVPAGKAATYNDTEVFDFPVGSVLVKTFAYPSDLRAPEKDIRLIETRLLIHQQAGWNAWTYVWNDDQSDAELKVAGKVVPIDVINHEGAPQSINYIVPNKNQCKGCHSFNGEITPIGPKAANLNKAFSDIAGAPSQLVNWSDQGVLTGLPPAEHIPTVWPKMNDELAPVDTRARAYLDVNCAHCHRREGPGSTSGLFLRFTEETPTVWGYKKRPVAAGRGSGGLVYDIAPGNADASILHYRMDSTDPGIMMPEVGRTLVHLEGLALIREWINQIK